MPHFSASSLERLNTCHPDLQVLFLEVIKEIDITILCGHRGEAEQNKAFADGASHVKWPNSKHNTYPSVAVDVAPWPINWNDRDSFTRLYETVKKKADELGIKIRWGADWNMNGQYWERANWEVDGPHYELVE